MTHHRVSPSSPQAALPEDGTCAACAGDCRTACFNDAIIAAAGGGYRIQQACCAGCGACISACRLGIIQLKQGVAAFALCRENRPIQ